MPHRTTYVFPRQFPDNRDLIPSLQTPPTAADHEEEKGIKSNNNKSNFNESDTINDDEKELLVKKFTGINFSNKKLASFYSWLAGVADKKQQQTKFTNDEQELLLPPEPEAAPAPSESEVAPALQTVAQGEPEPGFYQQVSLAQQSSCGSTLTAGSLISSEAQESQSTVRSSITARNDEVKEEERGEENQQKLAENARESHYLQLTVANRATSQTTIGHEPTMLLFDSGHGLSSDAEAVSYRLWVLLNR